MLQEFSPSHMTARTKLRELREHLKSLMPPEPSVIPGQRPRFVLPAPPVFTISDKALRDHWLKYLSWEEKNQLDFELASEAGKKDFANRLRGVYRRSVVSMRFYGEVWCVFVSCIYVYADENERFRWFTWNNSLEKKVDNSLDILKDGIAAVPLRCVLQLFFLWLY